MALIPYTPGAAFRYRPVPFEARLAGADDVCDVVIDGELDLATGPEVVEAVRSAAEASSGRAVVVDCRSVSFVDSRGIGALVTARDTASAAGKEMVLLSPSRRLLRVLALAAMGDAFPLRAD